MGSRPRLISFSLGLRENKHQGPREKQILFYLNG
jgi:hypothetical protein